MTVIETENLSFHYGHGKTVKESVLRNLSFKIEKGEWIGVIGRTGSGKSTLLKHFNGLLRPTAGRVFIEGKNIWDKPRKIREVRFRVGIVFQYPEDQLFAETVFDDIAFGPFNLGLDQEEVKQRVYKAAEFVGLKIEKLSCSPFELSGGEKRRAAIAGVLAMEPRILVLDEPTAGLDPEGRAELLDRLHSFHRKRKNTVIFASHRMEEVAQFSDRVLVMNEGKVVLFDTPSSVFSDVLTLENCGMKPPEITLIMNELAGRGVPISRGIVTVEQALSELCAVLSQKRRGML